VTAELRAIDVSVTIDGACLVDGVSLHVGAGEWVTVIGPNGAGKTTLLRALSAAQEADGTIELGGRPVGAMSPRERSRTVAVVPQDPVLPPGMRLLDYVLLGRTPHISLFGVERPEDVEAALGALEQLGLAELRDRPLDAMSGGERRRAVLARAITQEAPVLLLDEPTTSLDIGHQQEVLDLVDDLRHMRGLTVLATMHDLTIAGQYADRLVLMDRGRIVASGPAADVLTEDNVARHYGARVRVLHDEGGLVVLPVRWTTEGAVRPSERL
jgi:iron complex transport system ATP-binding protein